MCPISAVDGVSYNGVHSFCCTDANFEQKRCRNAGSADRPFPQTRQYFLSDEELDSERAYLDEKRGKGRKKKKEDEDATLPGLSLPNHVYDGCTSRFIAADESHAKAEATFFSDTGLMALLCRHGRVLWLVNLKDPGEKQFNVFALMRKLFSHLPEAWKVGLLYDIGCQLHHSMVKVCFQSNYSSKIHC